MSDKITESELNELKQAHNTLVDISDALSRAFVDASYLAADYSSLFALPPATITDKMGPLIDRMLQLQNDIKAVSGQ